MARGAGPDCGLAGRITGRRFSLARRLVWTAARGTAVAGASAGTDRAKNRGRNRVVLMEAELDGAGLLEMVRVPEQA